MSANNLPKSTVFSCFLAGCLEMYDFAIFGFLSALLHKNYLSFLSGSGGMIITYALFAVGFFFRPLGSLIFGYIGDVYGRKPALVLSVTLMGTASLGMCLLPSYQATGISACYIMALIRAIQGISVGGEYNGAVLYAIEHTNKNIGLVGSIVTAGGTLGVLIATFVSKIVQSPGMPEYSWRLAFLLGFGLSIVGYVIRKKLKETPIFNKRNSNQKGIPLIQGFKFLKAEFVAAFFISAASNTNFYFLLVFFPNYLKSINSIDTSNVCLMVTLLILVLVPIFGYLSDRLSRVTMLIIGFLSIGLYNIVFLDLVSSAPSLIGIMAYTIISAIIVAMTVGVVSVFVVEIFLAQYRFSNTALSYSLGVAIFGDTVPMVAAWIIERFGNVPSYIGIYVACVSLLGAMGGLIIVNKQKTILKSQSRITSGFKEVN
ncbi:MAG: MFS transporter [Rickettsiaceae bacterium]|nr:MAG: MFS transporter [Rickettsiaceae bacterium]